MLDPSLPIPAAGRTFAAHRRVRLADMDEHGRVRLDAVARFLQDVAIWENKVPVQNPLLCEEDGPVYQLRRWYEQFYVDVADIEPDMVARFEFEVDTTKANEFWHAEVEENLRLKAEQDAVGQEA